MKRLSIYLADLRYNYLGYISSDAMPLGIGYMKAVLRKRFPDFDVNLFAYPDKLEAAINDNPPDVLMLTNYTWNETLSLHFAKHTRIIQPDCLVIVGGPNIPVETERKIDFLKQNPSVDLYALGEGDFYASEIVELFLENDTDRHKMLLHDIHSSVYKKGAEYAVTEIRPRTRNIDDIPSPWLTGVMDEFFDGILLPLFETNRGCPFSCSFCVQGTKWYSKVNHFSLERIREELHYIAQKISTDYPQQKMLRIADPNFGMYNRDVDVASYIAETQVRYNYPLVIDATTGKNRAENIIETMEKVNGALVFYQAVQSLDDEVLENIQRANIKLDSYKALQTHIKGRGLRSSSDLILGLPGESMEKHLNSLEKLINSGTDKLNNFQAMLLKGSEMESVAVREKFNFVTRFRLLPKCHGHYFNENVFDTEEIIVSTKDLEFEDYLQARKHHLIINVFWNFTRFDGLLKLLKQFQIEPWSWLKQVLSFIDKSKSSPIYSFCEMFLAETKSELFHSEQDIADFYKADSNFKNLNSGEIGDNLIYKYRTLALFYYWEEIVNTAIDVTLFNIPPERLDDSLKQILLEYGKVIKNTYVHGKSEKEILKDYEAQFSFNVIKWEEDGFPIEDVSKYLFEERETIVFKLQEQNRANLEGTLKIWSFNPKSFSMFIRRIHNDWLKKTVCQKQYSL
jgi:radical SAM superfamily enzyme YgiQ (UPF0313 family)